MIRFSSLLLILGNFWAINAVCQSDHSINVSYGVGNIFSLDGEEPFPSGFGYQSVFAPAVGLEYAFIFGANQQFQISANFSHLEFGFVAFDSPIKMNQSGNLITGDRNSTLFAYMFDLIGSYRYTLSKKSFLVAGVGLSNIYRYRSWFEYRCSNWLRRWK